MQKALIYQADPDVSDRLRAAVGPHDWSIDVCSGMLEMLRLIEEHDYEIVVLSSDRMNVELSTLIGTIKTLQKNPRIIINLEDAIGNLAITGLASEGAVIRGLLTPEKFLAAAQEKQ